MRALYRRSCIPAETKVAQKDLPRTTACPPGFDSFWSFCGQRIKGEAIHGSAVCVKQDTVVTTKAEEGLTEKKALRTLKTLDPSATAADLIGDYALQDLRLRGDPEAFETEGRTIVLEMGMIVVFAWCVDGFTVLFWAASDSRSTDLLSYAPFEGISTDLTKADKLTKKMDYFVVLEARVRRAREAGKEVIVLGDLVRPISSTSSIVTRFARWRL